jgi:hypothetical protein
MPQDRDPVPIREDLLQAHRRAWERIARAGTWWTGAERVAMAAEARKAPACDLCRRRKVALSPNAIEGDHDTSGVLPPAVVDVIHRVRTDPGRLTRAWFDGVIASGLTDARYVEIVAVVVTVVGMDTFARALGGALSPLPEPMPGEPSRLRPAGATDQGAWVPMIAPEDASGPEADLYGEGRFVPNIRRALSLVPAEARAFGDLGSVHYFAIDDMMDLTRRRAITRPQIELLAARVSALNQCFY